MDARWEATPWTRLLLDAWRQVSEHLDIVACLDGLAPRLADVVPLRRVWVRRIEADQLRLETVAVAPWDTALTAVPTRRPLDEAELERLVAWAAKGKVEILDRETPLRTLVDPWRRSELALAGGLVDQGRPIGVVLIEGDRRLAAHVDLVTALLQPLVTALSNDLRVHELARLREAVEADNRALLTRLARDDIGGTVVGGDAGLRSVMLRVDQVAPTDAPVLILGETGAGKELVARAIHTRSRRASGPFLRINCGAIPADLVDSELFGHEKGSFTGATATRRGWFERADGGTLFLDEIGELPPAAQVRLLRVLQDGTFERVGGQRPMHADVRIVAATHRDLRAMVGESTFREDLWYRIGVFPIRLPPLREHLEDLPALATHFAQRAGQRLHGRPLAPSDDDLRLLAGYEWPGNVRELAAVIERAAILGDGTRLDVRGALGVHRDEAPGPTGGTPWTPSRAPLPPSLPSSGPPRGSLEEVNRRAIEAALERCGGRVEGDRGAAALLGLHPSTLRSRMKKFGIAWEAWRR